MSHDDSNITTQIAEKQYQAVEKEDCWNHGSKWLHNWDWGFVSCALGW